MAIADVSAHALAALVSLEGRRAVVTGGARGLGRAIGYRLAEAGAAVLLADLDEEAAARAAHEIGDALAAKVIAARADVADGASIVALAGTAVAKLGGIDIWVNNAGIYPSRPLVETSEEEWDRVLDINLRGTFLGCREAARAMIAAGHGGVIVNMASVAGLRGIAPGIARYVASKHGVVGLTQQLAIELAPHDIRVLAVAPTSIVTEGWLNARPAEAAESLLGRPGLPDDIARVVLFCASDLALFMTGGTIPVDAGRLSLG